MQGNRKMIINIKEEDEESDPSLLDMDKFRKEISPPPSLKSLNIYESNNKSNKKRRRQNNKNNDKRKQNCKRRKKDNSIFYFF